MFVGGFYFGRYATDTGRKSIRLTRFMDAGVMGVVTDALQKFHMP
jgi:hypothetical protein